MFRIHHLTAAAALSLAGCATTTKETPMTASTATNPTSSADVVRRFFAAFGSGDAEAVIATFHPEAQIVAVHEGTPNAGIYGTYVGRGGARTFLTTLGATFETKAFAVDHVVGDSTHAYASGHFTHQVKATGKPFTSEWALRCEIENGTIRRFHFYEDSAAYAEAAH